MKIEVIKANKLENYKSEYTNEYNEDWVFEFDYSAQIGFLKGSDVDWHSYAVYERQDPNLILDKEEISWLKSSWNDATKHINNFGIYLGLDTKFEYDNNNCWLTNDFCPICLKQKRDFDYHHCIWSMDGGTFDYFNMLKTCRSCHAIITHGSVEDQEPKNLAAYYHQIMYFGMKFFPQENPKKGKHKERNFLDLNPHSQKLVNTFADMSVDEQGLAEKWLMADARFKYQYFRDMGLGKWSWDEFERREKEHERMLGNLTKCLTR